MDFVFMKKWPNWLRWTLMLPSAIIGYIVLKLVVALISLIGGGIYSGPFVLSGYADYIIFPFSIVAFPANVAPKHKRIVVITMATIYSIVILILISISLYRYSILTKYDGYWLEIIGLVTTIIVAIIVAIFSSKNFAKKEELI